MTSSEDDPGTTTLRRLKSFDNEAWTKIIEAHFDLVFRWCQEGGLDPHTAADVTQEVFVSALGSLRNFQRLGDGSFGGWLRRICQRRVADYHRRKSEEAIGGTDAKKWFHQLEAIRTDLWPEKALQLEGMNDERLIEALAIAEKEFEETTWQAFWQTIMEGKSTTDAALELGITKNAVYLAKSRVTRRLRQLAEERE